MVQVYCAWGNQEFIDRQSRKIIIVFQLSICTIIMQETTFMPMSSILMQDITPQFEILAPQSQIASPQL